MEKVIANLKNSFLNRESQIDQLVHHMSHFWPTIFVYGLKETGKTSILKKLLIETDAWFAWVNCVEAYSNKLIFESILYQLYVKQTEGELKLFLSSDLLDFIENLKEIFSKQNEKEKSEQSTQDLFMSKCFIVFDDCKDLLINNSGLVSNLCRLQELTCNLYSITCIFMTNSSLDSIYKDEAFFSPIKIYFPSYNKKELLSILETHTPDGYSKNFYQNYLQLNLDVLYQVTRNLTELQLICQHNFPKYIEPIESGELNETDSVKLWYKYESHLEISIEQIVLKCENQVELVHELPYCSKYLLIASYLASYNSVRTDKRFFVKNQGKVRTIKRKKLKLKEKVNSGPKPFTFERLIHIYKSIVNLNSDQENEDAFLTDASNRILSQIESLVNLKLILRLHSVSTNWLSSGSKFIISERITSEFISEVSKELKFNVTSFLERCVIRQ